MPYVLYQCMLTWASRYLSAPGACMQSCRCSEGLRGHSHTRSVNTNCRLGHERARGRPQALSRRRRPRGLSSDGAWQWRLVPLVSRQVKQGAFSSRKSLGFGIIVHFVIIKQLISNHRLIRLKRFISYESVILCNSVFFFNCI